MIVAVDLFAGLGGFSEGARLAGGIRVAWAANHWPAAVEWHSRNHADTAHVCQDLQQADWSAVPAHDLLLASPECQGHTNARGKDQPRHDTARSTAWAVVSCAEVRRPSVLVVENVPEFRAWTLYPAWRMALEALGYTLAEHVLDAADHGVPQHREWLREHGFLDGWRPLRSVDELRTDPEVRRYLERPPRTSTRRTRSVRAVLPPCSRLHTPVPEHLGERRADAEARRARGEHVVACPRCGRFAVWMSPPELP